MAGAVVVVVVVVVAGGGGAGAVAGADGGDAGGAGLAWLKPEVIAARDSAAMQKGRSTDFM